MPLSTGSHSNRWRLVPHKHSAAYRSFQLSVLLLLLLLMESPVATAETTTTAPTLNDQMGVIDRNVLRQMHQAFLHPTSTVLLKRVVNPREDYWSADGVNHQERFRAPSTSSGHMSVEKQDRNHNIASIETANLSQYEEAAPAMATIELHGRHHWRSYHTTNAASRWETPEALDRWINQLLPKALTEAISPLSRLMESGPDASSPDFVFAAMPEEGSSALPQSSESTLKLENETTTTTTTMTSTSASALPFLHHVRIPSSLQDEMIDGRKSGEPSMHAIAMPSRLSFLYNGLWESWNHRLSRNPNESQQEGQTFIANANRRHALTVTKRDSYANLDRTSSSTIMMDSELPDKSGSPADAVEASNEVVEVVAFQTASYSLNKESPETQLSDSDIVNGDLTIRGSGAVIIEIPVKKGIQLSTVTQLKEHRFNSNVPTNNCIDYSISVDLRTTRTIPADEKEDETKAPSSSRPPDFSSNETASDASGGYDDSEDDEVAIVSGNSVWNVFATLFDNSILCEVLPTVPLRAEVATEDTTLYFVIRSRQRYYRESEGANSNGVVVQPGDQPNGNGTNKNSTAAQRLQPQCQMSIYVGREKEAVQRPLRHVFAFLIPILVLILPTPFLVRYGAAVRDLLLEADLFDFMWTPPLFLQAQIIAMGVWAGTMVRRRWRQITTGGGHDDAVQEGQTDVVMVDVEVVTGAPGSPEDEIVIPPMPAGWGGFDPLRDANVNAARGAATASVAVATAAPAPGSSGVSPSDFPNVINFSPYAEDALRTPPQQITDMVLISPAGDEQVEGGPHDSGEDAIAEGGRSHRRRRHSNSNSAHSSASSHQSHRSSSRSPLSLTQSFGCRPTSVGLSYRGGGDLEGLHSLQSPRRLIGGSGLASIDGDTDSIRSPLLGKSKEQKSTKMKATQYKATNGTEMSVTSAATGEGAEHREALLFEAGTSWIESAAGIADPLGGTHTPELIHPSTGSGHSTPSRLANGVQCPGAAAGTSASGPAPAAAVAGTSEEEEEEKVCRICRDGEEDEALVAPCECTGSVRWIHRSCLDRWRLESVNRNHQNVTHCEICRKPFTVNIKRSTLFAERYYYLMNSTLLCLVCLTLGAFFIVAFHEVVGGLSCSAPYHHVNRNAMFTMEGFLVSMLLYAWFMFGVLFAKLVVYSWFQHRADVIEYVTEMQLMPPFWTARNALLVLLTAFVLFAQALSLGYLFKYFLFLTSTTPWSWEISPLIGSVLLCFFLSWSMNLQAFVEEQVAHLREANGGQGEPGSSTAGLTFTAFRTYVQSAVWNSDGASPPPPQSNGGISAPSAVAHDENNVDFTAHFEVPPEQRIIRAYEYCPPTRKARVPA